MICFYFLFCFANVTSLGRAPFDFLSGGPSSQFDAVGLAETHHVAAERTTKDLRLARFTGHVAPATPGSGAGSHGGAFLGARLWLRTEPLPDLMLKHYGLEDLAPLRAHLGGITVVLVAAYLLSDPNWVGANRVRLSRMGAFLRLLAEPWMVLADWNATPEELSATGWLAEVGGIITTPSNVVATCIAPPARMIDYAVLSSEFSPLLLGLVGDLT